MKICILDNNQIPYNSNYIYYSQIRGAENAIINLSNELAILNHEVYVFNNVKKNIKLNNVNWININNIKNKPYFDIAITNNDIRLLDNIKSNKKFAISHSIQTLEKFIRKKQFYSYLKNKPKIILLGNYHFNNRNFFLRMFGFIKTSWGVDDFIIDKNINDVLVDNNKAIFTSHSDRNLKILIDIWKDKIFPNNKLRKLFITPISNDFTKYNIYNRHFTDKVKMIEQLSSSRLLLLPGHKAELFCIAAEEGRELCVPIVTLGIGSLSERVIHGKTGFIAKNFNEFSNYTLELFNSDRVWNELRFYLKKLRGSLKWKKITSDLLSSMIN